MNGSMPLLLLVFMLLPICHYSLATCGTNTFCTSYFDVYPKGVETISTANLSYGEISDTDTNFYIFFKINDNPCINPAITFEYEQIDIALDTEYISVYDESNSLISQCQGNGGADFQCETFWTCIDRTSLGISNLTAGSTYTIRLLESSATDLLCTAYHSYSINCKVSLICDPIPTNSPTSEPTVEPTNGPTKIPSNDPTVDPTTEPTIDPTTDPTTEPTTDPTNQPSSDPTNDPTTDPTIDPTTTSPTTGKPTTAQPTIEIIDSNDFYKHEPYVVLNSYDPISYYEATDYCAQHLNQSVLASIDMDDETYSQQTQINIMTQLCISSGNDLWFGLKYDSTSGEFEWSNGQILDPVSEGGSSITNWVEDNDETSKFCVELSQSNSCEWMSVTCNDLKSSILCSNPIYQTTQESSAQQQTVDDDDGETSNMDLIWILIIVILIYTFFAVISYIYSRCFRINDFYKLITIIIAAVYANNTLSDILFAVNVTHDSRYGLLNDLTIIMVLSIVFIIIPVLITLLQLYRDTKKWKENNNLDVWISGNINTLYVLSIIQGSSFAGVEMCNSNAFNLDRFDMGLDRKQLMDYTAQRIYSTLLQDIPQLALQIWYISLSNNINYIVYASTIFSVLSIIISIMFMMSRRNMINAGDYASIQFDVTGTPITDNFDECRNRINKLKFQMSLLLGIPQNLIEIIRPKQVQKGLRVQLNIYASDALSVDTNLEREMNKARETGELVGIMRSCWNLSSDPLITNIKFNNMVILSKQKAYPQPGAEDYGIEMMNSTDITAGELNTGDVNELPSLPKEVPLPKDLSIPRNILDELDDIQNDDVMLKEEQMQMDQENIDLMDDGENMPIKIPPRIPPVNVTPGEFMADDDDDDDDSDSGGM